MTGVDVFRRWVPRILEADAAGDVRAAEFIRQAVSTLAPYELPIGVKVDQTWLLALPKKLESPNRTIWRHWRVLKRERDQWEALLRRVVVDLLGCASWGAVVTLGRQPSCTVAMQLTTVRLVGSVREFIRDADNLTFSSKHARDALKRLQLIKDDSRRWFRASDPIQDVSPIGVPVTVFILRPASADLLQERVHVYDRQHPLSSRASGPPNGGAEEGRAVGRVRRRAGPRAVDLGSGERTRS